MIKSMKFYTLRFLLCTGLSMPLMAQQQTQQSPEKAKDVSNQFGQAGVALFGIIGNMPLLGLQNPQNASAKIGKPVKVVQLKERRNGGLCTNATNSEDREVFCYKEWINREYYEFDYNRPNPQTKRLVLSEFDPSKMLFVKTAVVEMRFDEGLRHTSVDLIEDDKPSFHVATTFRAGDGRTDEADLILVLETGMGPVIPEPYKKGYELVFINFTDQIEQSPVSAHQLDGGLIEQVAPPKESQVVPTTPQKSREMTEDERKYAQVFLDKFVTNNNALSTEAKAKLSKLALSQVGEWVVPNHVIKVRQDGNKITITIKSGEGYYYLDEMTR